MKLNVVLALLLLLNSHAFKLLSSVKLVLLFAPTGMTENFLLLEFNENNIIKSMISSCEIV